MEKTSWFLVQFRVKMWPSLFQPLPLQPEWAPEAGDVSTMSLKGETELGQMKREAGRGLKGPEVLGAGGFRGPWRERELGEGTTCRRGQVLSWTVKGPGGIWLTCPHWAAAQAPASHPKYMCSPVSASLGWIRAQLWGPHGPGGAKYRLPRGKSWGRPEPWRLRRQRSRGWGSLG